MWIQFTLHMIENMLHESHVNYLKMNNLGFYLTKQSNIG